MPKIEFDKVGNLWLAKGGESSPLRYQLGVDAEKLNRIFLSASKSINWDTYTYNQLPDENFSSNIQLRVGNVFIGVSNSYRSLLKCDPNKILNINLESGWTHIPKIRIQVFEIDPELFSITTVTWNTQPATGVLITTFDLTAQGWYLFSTGTTGAICLLSDSTQVGYFSSSEAIDSTLRPYTSDP